MKSIRLSIITLLFCGMATATFATTYYWDHSQSAHWARSKNWNSGGAGGFPDATSADAWLVYNNYPNSGGQGVGAGKMNVSVDDNDSNVDTFSVRDLLIATDASDQHWTFVDGSTAGKIIVYRDMIFDLQNSGTITFDVEIELGDNLVDLYARGTRATLNGKLIGGSSSVLDASDNQGSIAYGGIKLTSSNNDGFLGTIKTGTQKVEITQVNGLRNATIEISSSANSFIYPNNALIGALGGTYNLALNNNLKVGNNNKATTYGGQFSQSGALTKEGTATWTLSGASTHTGQTTINGGKIKLGHINALQDSQVWLNVHDGLNLNGFDATIGGLGGGGNLALGSSALTIKNTTDPLYLGAISGTGSIIIDSPSGSQDFGAANSYSGGTTLKAGILYCKASGTLGNNSGALTLGDGTLNVDDTHTQSRALDFLQTNSDGTIEVGSSKTLTWTGSISGHANNALNKTGAGTLAISSTGNAYPGTFLFTAGALTLAGTSMQNATVDVGVDNAITFTSATTTFGGLSGSSNFSIPSGKTLTVGNNDSDTTFSGQVSGSGDVTKVGSGTFTLDNFNLFSGELDLNEGELELDLAIDQPYLAASFSSLSNTTLSGTSWIGSALTVAGNISPQTPGGGITGTLKSTSMALTGTFDCDVDGSANDLLIVTSDFDPTGATIDLNFFNGAPSQASYTLVSGPISGTFETVLSLPGGYRLEYNANSIKLIQDSVLPTLDSITLKTPLTDPTSSNTVQFDLTFSENVIDVGMNDLLPSFSGNGNSFGTGVVTGSGSTRVVTIPDVSGNGTFSLSLRSGAWIFDEAGNRIDRTVLASASVEIDQTIPTVTGFTTAEASPNNATSIAYTVMFSEPISGLVDYTDFYITGTTVAGTDIAASTVVNSGGGTNFTITLNNISGDGFLQFRLKANQIADPAGNNLASDPFSPGLTIDNTAPVLALNGDDALSLDFGAAWSDPSATADDGSAVVIGGDTVNTAVPAIYTPTYDATDVAGNIATQLTRTVTVRTAYLSWALDKGLTEGVNDGLTDNPDGDNWNNRAEYALNGEPLSDLDDGKVAGGLTDVGGTNYLTHTFPALDGTAFGESPHKAGFNGNIGYIVTGSTNLLFFNEEVIEVSPALTNGMPTLNNGWGYHTFRFHTDTAVEPKAFIKLKIEPSAL